MNLIEKFAPYPKDEDAATAENVYRYLLVSAQVSYLRWQQTAAERRRAGDDAPDSLGDLYMAGIELFISHWSTLHLLRHAMGRPVAWVRSGDYEPVESPTADDVAREMWIGWEDGGGPGEALWEWLVEAGFAPEDIEVEYAKIAGAAAAE